MQVKRYARVLVHDDKGYLRWFSELQAVTKTPQIDDTLSVKGFACVVTHIVAPPETFAYIYVREVGRFPAPKWPQAWR